MRARILKHDLHMNNFDSICRDIEKGIEPDDGALKLLLELEDEAELQRLFSIAYDIKTRYVGRKVYFRGLVELSNICTKNCLYCGIRKGNSKVNRFILTKQEIVEETLWALKSHYGSVVLQSGERSDPEFVDFIEDTLREITLRSEGKLGITLSLGEQSFETYRRWFEAGAQRYLLRIESSDPELYHKLHPADHSYEERVDCLRHLQKAGFQTGTGVMIGLPFQTTENLIHDLLFFQKLDIDMIGMGPYLVHPDTPLAEAMPEFEAKRKHQLKMGLKMIACARILLKDVNIASTTALQALDSNGRQQGLLAGANVMMPNITDTRYRAGYQLYAGKPGMNENSEESKISLEQSILAIGETIGYDEWGNPKHFYQRTGKE